MNAGRRRRRSTATALQALLAERALGADAPRHHARSQPSARRWRRPSASRLQPHFIRSFFLEGFARLGGQGRGARARPLPAHAGPGRHPPAGARGMGLRPTLVPEYERIAFDKATDQRRRASRSPSSSAPATRSSTRRSTCSSSATATCSGGAPSSSTRPTPAPTRGCSSCSSTRITDARTLSRWPAADQLAPHGVRGAAARRQLDARRPRALPRLRPRDRRGDRRGRRRPRGVLAHRRARGPRHRLRDRRPRARATSTRCGSGPRTGSPRPSPPCGAGSPTRSPTGTAGPTRPPPRSRPARAPASSTAPAGASARTTSPSASSGGSPSSSSSAG